MHTKEFISSTSSLPLYALAFRMVMPVYQELQAASGTIRATAYDRQAEAGRATNTGRSCLVETSDSDFLADVEISARRCLTSVELAYFDTFYKSGAVAVLTPPDIKAEGSDTALTAHLDDMPEDIRAELAKLDTAVRQKMGKRLIEVGLSPLGQYRAPVDVSGRMLSDGTLPRRSLLRPIPARSVVLLRFPSQEVA